MTITDATFAGTLPAIIRTDDHRYIYQGVTYPGVTNVLKVLDKSGPLMTWAARETAEAAVAIMENPAGMAMLFDSVGRDGIVKAVTARSNWKRDEAAQLGSRVHAWADLFVQGVVQPLMTDTEQVYTKAYADWWQNSGWRLRLSEAVVVAPLADHRPYGWGGTFDLLCYDADGRTVLADIKTGKGVYREAILQLTAYGLAPLVSPMGSDTVYPMPFVHRYVVLHVTKDGVREVELSVGSMEVGAWVAALDLHHWIETVKGKL